MAVTRRTTDVGGGRPGLRAPRVNALAVSGDSMKFKSGAKKTKAGGKKNATFNLQAVADVLAAEGLNPAVEVVKALKGGKLDAKTAASVALALLEYCQPKLKSVEHKGTVAPDPVQVEAQLRRLLEKAGI